MSSLLIGFTVASTFLIYKFKNIFKRKTPLEKTVVAHTKLNQEWLKEFGTVVKVEIEEPVNYAYLDIYSKSIINFSGELIGDWKPFTDEMWRVHCKSIHHDKNLVEKHCKAYINPDTRWCRLRYTFNLDDIVYQIEPCRRFFELELEYFTRNSLLV